MTVTLRTNSLDHVHCTCPYAGLDGVVEAMFTAELLDIRSYRSEVMTGHRGEEAVWKRSEGGSDVAELCAVKDGEGDVCAVSDGEGDVCAASVINGEGDM